MISKGCPATYPSVPLPLIRKLLKKNWILRGACPERDPFVAESTLSETKVFPLDDRKGKPEDDRKRRAPNDTFLLSLLRLA